MNILFRVDASASMGMGHLMRCLALAQGLASKQHAIQFLVNKQTQEYCLSRKDWQGELIVLPESDDLLQQARCLCAYLADMQPDILVLDGYQFNQGYRSILAKSDIPLVLFDDNNNSGDLHADMVINSAANADKLGYDATASNAKYCLGSDYRILRQEFSGPDIQQAAKQWNNRQALSILMGGSDPDNATLQLLQQLQEKPFSAPIEVATGGAYAFAEQLENFKADTRLNITHHKNCQEIAELFVRSKLVISAAGGTQFELLACGAPAILLVVADNQVNATQQAVNQGWCQSYDLRDDDCLSVVVAKTLSLWSDDAVLESMHQKANMNADVSGTKRVVNAIEKLVM